MASIQGVQIAQKVGHSFRFNLKAWHWWGFSTHDLVDERAVRPSFAHGLKAWAHKTLSCDAMTASAVDAKQLRPMLNIAIQCQRRPAVGIETGAEIEPGPEGYRCDDSHDYQRRHQTTASFRRCSS